MTKGEKEAKEEKEAIKLLKQEPDFSLSYYKREYAIDIVLKLVEKQQKEIEELQKDKKVLIKNYDKVLGTFISKDKIIEILNNTEKNIEEDRPSIVLENLILNIEELLGE
jgi:hypothetical protein